MLYGHMSEVRGGAWRGADCGLAGARGAAPRGPAHSRPPPPTAPGLVYVPLNTTIVVIITAGRSFVHEFQAVD